MFAAPMAYARAMGDGIRRVTPFISIGVGFDATAADDIVAISYSGLEMSNETQITDANYIMTPGLATFEGDGIPTAAEQGMIAPPLEAVAYPPEAGVWSDVISDRDGVLDWSLDVSLSQAHSCAFSVYTDSVHILRGRLTYYLNGTVVRDVTIDNDMPVFGDPVITEYDRVTFTALKIDKPYCHLRIPEIEFGASLTYSNSKLGGTLSLVEEIDPLGLNMPLYELNFSLVNVYGQYDPDNPNTELETLKQWFPVTFAFTVETDEGPKTVPMGRFLITERVGQDELMRITAQDARAVLQSIISPITMSTSESIGKMYERILTDLKIPYVIEDSVYSVMPDKDITLNAQEWSLLTQAQFIQQYYGIHLIPGRDNNLYVMKPQDIGVNPPITAENMITFPEPAAAKKYNFISVKYKSGNTSESYNIDLRGSPTEATAAITVNNPLVTDAANAERIARAVQAAIYSQKYTTETLGDATIDPGDKVPIEGRWTQGNADVFKVTTIDWKYDGALLMTIDGVR